ncbi:GNAT family N-acetyltransferase [Pseudalkalibacillus sp. R45]|uniref:GNAT family N-acetyltransferase n=1 Tax=Pseudalkalibacillus sp. R45 TaxID=3457433 RepID=UPI003FCEB866
MAAIRRAKPEEAQLLSDLALLSKAQWDYSEEFILTCRDALTLSEKYIEKNEVYVLEDNRKVLGFFAFVIKNGQAALDFMYLNPGFIGEGYGKQLWSHVVHRANELDISSFTIDSDPHAMGFYEKMGAVKIGETPSTVFADRKLPLMKYEVS